jgi:hypothetical protein
MTRTWELKLVSRHAEVNTSAHIAFCPLVSLEDILKHGEGIIKFVWRLLRL